MKEITLKEGDHVLTAGMSIENYDRVGQAFLRVGFDEGEFPRKTLMADSTPSTFGVRRDVWSIGVRKGRLVHGDRANYHGRTLTLEQVVGSATTEPKDSIENLKEALEKRDEYEAEYQQALADVSAELGKGFILREAETQNQRVILEPKDWQAGGIVQCISDEPVRFEKGNRYEVSHNDGSTCIAFINNDGEEWFENNCNFRFHHRPA